MMKTPATIRKNFIPIVVFCLVFQQVSAQSGVETRTNGSGTSMAIIDMNGKPFRNNNYADVEGTPFLNDKWQLADLVLNNGKKLMQVRARINEVSNEVHFLSVNDEEFSTPAGLVKEIRFSDSSETPVQSSLYQSGFPPIDGMNEQNFYEVISAGKLSLLRSGTKKIEDQKSDMSGETKKVFKSYEEFYVQQAGTMKRIKKEKSAVLELMADQKDKIESYAAAQKINFKNTDSLKKLFNYYNTL